MTEIEKEQKFNEFLKEWTNNRYPEWKEFYQYICENKKITIYKLNEGSQLMDLLDTIMGNIESYFYLPDDNSHLIPSRFSSVSHLVNSLKNFKEIVRNYKPIINKNITNGVIDNDIVSQISTMVNEIEELANRCNIISGKGELPRPYQILREKLFNKDIEGFVSSVNSVLKGVPYISRKKSFNESHFQTMVQLLLTVLGFEPIAEQPLSDARIDMVIKLNSLVYIFEFKYTKGSQSNGAYNALQQIKVKNYADPYKLTANEIIGVGFSFSGVTKNINSYKEEQLFNNTDGYENYKK